MGLKLRVIDQRLKEPATLNPNNHNPCSTSLWKAVQNCRSTRDRHCTRDHACFLKHGGNQRLIEIGNKLHRDVIALRLSPPYVGKTWAHVVDDLLRLTRKKDTDEAPHFNVFPRQQELRVPGLSNRNRLYQLELLDALYVARLYWQE